MSFPLAFRAFLAALLVGVVVGLLPSDRQTDFTAETPQIQKDVKAMSIAGATGDGETYIEYLHPKVFEGRIGSKKVVLETMLVLKPLLQELGAVTGGAFQTKVEFPKPPTYLPVEQTDFAIVPVRIETGNNLFNTTMNTFFVGVRSVGQTDWKYVDGMKLDQRAIKDMFPDFPLDQPLPLVHKSTKKNREAIDKFVDRLVPR